MACLCGDIADRLIELEKRVLKLEKRKVSKEKFNQQVLDELTAHINTMHTKRYGIEYTFTPFYKKQIKLLATKVGLGNAKVVLERFYDSNDWRYQQKAHDLTLAVWDANKLLNEVMGGSCA